RVIGIGIETADMLVHEVLSRPMRDRKAVARYAGLTGSPDESGARRREQGLARAGNARVRRGMIQLAWRFLRFQNQSALAQWYRARTADSRPGTRKTMIVASEVAGDAPPIAYCRASLKARRLGVPAGAPPRVQSSLLFISGSQVRVLLHPPLNQRVIGKPSSVSLRFPRLGFQIGFETQPA